MVINTSSIKRKSRVCSSTTPLEPALTVDPPRVSRSSVSTTNLFANCKGVIGGGQIASWLFSVTVVLAAWQVAAAYIVAKPSVFPTLPVIFQAGLSLATIGFEGQTLLSDILASVSRIAIGFGIAVVLGVLVGFLMAVSRTFSRLIDPWLQFIRPIPPLAYVPLLIVWFGIGATPKILTIIVGTIPVIILGTYSGAQSVPIDLVRGAQCLGANRLQVLRLVIFRSALPSIFTSMRTGIGIAWTYLVAAELIAARSGLGWLVQNAAQALSVATVIAAIVVIGALGYAMDVVIRIAEHFVVPWKGKI